MSAGQSLRRGFAYGVSTPVRQPPASQHRHEYDAAISLVVTAAVTTVVLALLSNQVVVSALGRLIGPILFR